MKKLSLILSLTASVLFSVAAQAEYTFVNCQSNQGKPHNLTLILANQNLVQVRIRVGTRPRALMPTKLGNQDVQGATLYSVRGMVGVMEVDNQILTGNGGLIKFTNDEFSCL